MADKPNASLFMSRTDEEASQPIEACGRRWPRLTLDQYFTVEAELRKERRKSALELAKSAELKGADLAVFLQRSDPFDVSMGEVYAWLETPKGARILLAKSLEGPGVTPDEITAVLNDVPIGALTQLARLVGGFIVRAGETNPLTSGTGERGSPSSDTSTTPTPAE
jgi:hypothetical protein